MSKAIRRSRDYTGVATRDLRALILQHVEDTEGFAHKCGIPERSLYRVLAEEYPLTNLSIADLICCELDLNVTAKLTVVPARSWAACVKMAADEFWLQKREASKADLHARAKELEAMRDRVLGAPSERQRANIDRGRAREVARYRGEAA